MQKRAERFLRPVDACAKIETHVRLSCPLPVPILIDTAAVPARERLDFWTELSCAAYVPLQIRSAERGQFWARMSGHELGPLSVFRIAAAANTMIRTSRAVAAGDPECFDLSVIVSGQLTSAQEGRTGVARTGDVMSKQTSYPMVLCADKPFESIVVRVPRELLRGDATQIGSRTSVPMSGSAGASRAAARLLRELAGALEDGTIAHEDEARIVENVVDLIRGLYAAPGGSGEPKPLRSRAEILLAIESYIDRKLGDPNLGPDEIARASFISTRYLHKLFEAEGTSVSGWIRAARLERCRRDLLDPSLDHQTIITIASRWGLPGPQHFSRVFRMTYGCSPRELRREARRAGAGQVPAAVLAARPAPRRKLSALQAVADDSEAA